MARKFAPATSDYIHWGDIHDLNGIDFTLFIRALPTGTNDGYLINKWASPNGFYLRRLSGNIIFGTNNNSGQGHAESAGSPSNWLVDFNVAGPTATVYKNNVAGTPYWQASPNANSTTLGVGNRADLIRDYAGDLCEFAIWKGVRLSAEDRATLELTGNPLAVSVLPDFYAPLINDTHDLIGGSGGTIAGSPSVTAHPSITMLDDDSWAPFGAAAGGDTNVLATTDALTLTENTATVNAETNVLATTDTLTLAEQAATVNAETNVLAATDALTLTEYIATINAEINVLAGTDALTLAEYTVVISSGTSILATTDALTLTEYTAIVNAGINVLAGADALALVTYAANVALSATIEANTDTLTLATYTATINAETNVLANTDALVIATYTASLISGTEVITNPDTLALTTYAAAISYAFNILAGTDSLVLTGYPATILVRPTNTAPITAANSPIPMHIGNTPIIDDPQVYEAVLHVHSAIDAILIELSDVRPDYSEIIAALQAYTKARTSVKEITANYNLLSTDGTIKIYATSNIVTALLPTAVGIKGTRYVLKCMDETWRAFVSTNDAELIDDLSEDFELFEGESLIVQSDGINWIVI